jgi:glycosyltransferase involved in cell wall biosynthesis
MRIAWFSPLPPDRSGIAAYSAELLPMLSARHQIEAFVDDGEGEPGLRAAHTIPGITIRGAFDFAWRHATAPFDVCVYQIGNQLCHNYMWPYLVRYPGLVVIHDGQLHHARAAGLIKRRRFEEYRAEFAYCHPSAPPALHELVISGMGEAVASMYFDHPMVRIPVEAARVTAVHNSVLAEELSASVPDSTVVAIRQGVHDVSDAAGGRQMSLRHSWGIPDDAVVFVAFGRATPEKRLGAAVKAMGQIRASGLEPQPWLICVGDRPDYYDVRQDAATAGVEDHVVVTGYVDGEGLGRYLALADACVCLRWPTGRETSAAWLRCVAAGKPTIVSDLSHLTDVPMLDPRTLATLAPVDRSPEDREPIGFIVELTDEVQMIRLAMRHLVTSARLRGDLGRAARRYWSRHATVELMAGDYEALLERTRGEPSRPHPDWPVHLTQNGTALGRQIAQHMGVEFGWM